MINKQILYFLIIFTLSLNVYGQENVHKKASKRPKVGLVLSGGGAKGYAYIGLLKALHEVNMPIDFIGGSSIGAIAGAMYSIGYHPDTIEHLVRSQDWTIIINNKLDRKYKAFEERLFTEKDFLSVPIDSNGLSFGSSLTESLNIDLLLNRLFSPASHISDFNDFEIPFLCMGTDLLTGKGVVLNKGSLPQAIRASMSIPGYFPPKYYQGHYLIDGGVVNNYPAEQVKLMGADIIIGGDVQAKSITSIDQLNSIPKILDHIIGYQRIEANEKGRALTDYYLRFEMDYSMMDFDKYDSIIALGYRIAMNHYDELKILADSLNKLEAAEPMKLNTAMKEYVSVGEIIIEGNENLKKKIVKNFFDEQSSDSISLTKIEESIKHLSGTSSFKDLNYELYRKDEKDFLKLTFKKAGQGVLSAGMNYNNDYQGNINLSLVFRNLWNTRAKLFTDLVIGGSPRLYSLFLVNNGKAPGIGVDIDFYSFDFLSYVDGQKKNSWNYRNFTTSAFMPITFNNNTLIKAGFRYDYFRYDQEFPDGADSTRSGEFDHFAQIFASINVDNRDKAYFSTKGGKMQLKFKYALPVGEAMTESGSNNFYAFIKYHQNMKIIKGLVFKPSIFAGYAHQNTTAMHSHLYAIGGQSSFSYVEGFVPFTGLRFIERYGLYAGVLRTHLQYNVYKKFYLSLMGDYGFVELDWSNIDEDAIAVGYGAKLSYDSFIGPISASIMGSNEVAGVSYFINIGFPLK